MRNLNRGEELTKEELEEIYYHLYITKHARERLKLRNSNIKQVLETIKNPYLAYFNTDGSINIAPNEWQCYVLAKNNYGNYSLITYKEEVWLSMTEKQNLAKKGIDRKEK